MNMKTPASLALAACSLVALAACASPTASTPVPAVTVTETQTERPAPAPVPEAPSTSDDDLYLGLLYSSSSWYDDIDENTLIELGRSICDALDSGATLEQIAIAAMDSGVPTERAAELTAASILAYCPWNESIVNS